MGEENFSDFFRALLRGDPRAYAELDRRYGPYLRQVTHPWLADAGLGSASDSVDLCQNALVKLLARLKSDDPPVLRTHDDLRNLLCRIARNDFVDLCRKEGHAGRGKRPVVTTPLGTGSGGPADSASSPSQHAAREELEAVFLGRLSPEARQVRQWREQGRDWAGIGTALGQPPNTVRIRYNRECQRLAAELGLEGWR